MGNGSKDRSNEAPGLNPGGQLNSHDEKTEGASGLHLQGSQEFNTNLSSLLANFRSTSLLSSAPDEPSPQPTCECECKDIASSLRAFNICKRMSSKQRLRRLVNRCKQQSSKDGGNNPNLAIAASCHQKPLLWPGRLSRNRKTLTPKLLQPARLKCNLKHNLKDSAPSGKGSISCQLKEEIVDSLRSNTSLRLSPSGRPCPGKSDSIRLFGSGQCRSQPPSSFGELSTSYAASSEGQHQHVQRYVFPNSDLYRSSFNNHSPWGSDATSTNRRHSSPASCSRRGRSQHPPPVSALDSTTAGLSAALPQSTDSADSSMLGRTCSREVRMEETNVNELASYFEDFLHIPRKMSSMAEMMYA